MNRFLLAAAAAIFLLAACSPSANRDAAPQASSAVAPAPPTIVKANFSKSDTAEIPVEIKIPSAVGEVVFLHQKHIAERGMQCVDCHHQINAKKLDTPHPDYLTSSSVNCKTCHNGASKNEHVVVYTCSGCHHTNPVDIADETLSAKVVVHKQCWKCHAVATGKDASTSCELCHSGKRTL